jgi:hypothetical protein
MTSRDSWNACRWSGDDRGHYESWFARANSADGQRAFWIRYTIFAPAGRRQDAVGERWAIVFDRDRETIIAVKDVHPIARCTFDRTKLGVAIDDAELDDRRLHGHAATKEHEIAWDLRYEGEAPPLLLLPEALYAARLPKAKALVGRPLARFQGTLRVDGEAIAIDDWVGSHNHNWGSKHTDHYAWGQVAGFDEAPGTFLECSTARIKLGPVWSPWLSPLVLRLPDREFAFNGLVQAARARGEFRPFEWALETGNRETRIEVRIEAPASEFVALRYGNPPGGTKTCLNSKIARCRVRVETRGEPAQTLLSRRAAFEILTDPGADDHGLVPVV